MISIKCQEKLNVAALPGTGMLHQTHLARAAMQQQRGATEPHCYATIETYAPIPDARKNETIGNAAGAQEPDLSSGERAPGDGAAAAAREGRQRRAAAAEAGGGEGRRHVVGWGGVGW